MEGGDTAGVGERHFRLRVLPRCERIAARLQEQDLRTPLGQPRRQHRAAGAAADHDVAEGLLRGHGQKCLR